MLFRSNIKFIYAPDRVTYKTYATSDSVDIFFDTWNNYYEAEQNGYRLTVPYLNASIFRVYRKDNTKFNTVALLRDTYIAAKYRDVFETSFSEIKYYNTIDEVVDAIYTGKQDVAFFYSRTAELVSYNDITNKLIAENMYEKNVNFSVGVSAKQDTLLYSILNKCVASIGEQELEIIADKYCDYSNQPFTFIGYLYDNPFFLAFLILATSLAILLLGTILIIWQKRRREKKAYALERKTNELLTSALAAAEKADLAKSHFLSRVSHEMRTPLNAIIGFLSLSRESSPDQSQTYLSNSEVAAKHLLSVINDVLDMSAIESGKINIAHTTFDFKQLITSISEIFVSQCAQKGISFETKLLTDTDECLIGDSHRLNQILMNLLGNSLKFTSEGSIQLIISQLSPSENTIILRLKVCDTGCGMNEDMLGRLFKPFEQESADTARKYGGSGLGLSIVKNLVTLMGGAISVESELGLGSTFTIDLPFERSNTLNSTMPKLDASLESLHVLVVDDEFADCEYMSMVLGRLGIIHTCVTNGDHALKEIQDGLESNHPYDMCLIDFKMPDMDGIEVTKQIRSAFGKDMIVIVISAYEQYQMTESVKNSGANLFVSKPLFQSTLLDLFMTITGGSATKTPTNLIKYDLSNHRILLARSEERRVGKEC